MANKKINELSSRTPALSDLMIVGDPSSGYSYKCTVTALATIIETDIADGYVTIGTTQTISGAKTFSNNLTLTSVVNTPTDPDKFLTLNASNVVTYRTGAEVLSDIGGQASLSGTGLVKSTSGTISYITDNSSNWNTAYNDSIVSAAVSGTTTKTLTLTQQDGGTLTASWSDLNTDAVTSVFGRTGAVVATEGDYSLNLLSDVTLTSPSNGQVLKYNGTTWVNDTDANTGTVTSVGLSSATSGVTIGSTPITTSGTITLAIATASGSQQGLLSSTDWTTFNNKQNALTLTTTGNSGAATLVGSTLNIPQYQSVLTNPVTGTGTTNYIPKFTSSSAIGNSTLFDDGTSIGFGTTSPNVSLFSRALTISSANSGLELTSATNVVQGVLGSNTLGLSVSGVGTAGIRFFTSASGATSERMRLDASGNLGLGTSAPSVPLEVNGAIRTTRSGVASQYLQLEGGDAVGQFITAVGAAKVLTIRNNSTTSSQITFDQAVASKYAFKQAGGESMVLDASGNLGLGVTPSAWATNYKAVQIGTAGISMLGGTSGINSFGQFGQNYYYDGINYRYLTSATANFINMSNGVIAFFNAPSGTAGNAITFTQAMTLDASGRLGIGTTSPQSLLNTASTGQVQIGTASWPTNFVGKSNARTLIGNEGILVVWNEAAAAANNTAAIYLGAKGGGTNGATTIAGGAIEGIAESASTNAGALAFETNGGSGNAERMRITSGGNVGIGVTNPGYKLEINGNQQITGTQGLLRLRTDVDGRLDILGQNGYAAYIYFGEVGAADRGVIGYASGSGDLQFRTGATSISNGSERMRLTSSGELLINTTSDAGDYKLQVNGAIYGTYDITLNSYPGYGSGSSNFYYNGTDSRFVFNANLKANNGEFNGSIKTAAPSGGTAKPIKFGEIVTLGGSNTQGVRVEIDGTVYYLVTGYLP